LSARQKKNSKKWHSARIIVRYITLMGGRMQALCNTGHIPHVSDDFNKFNSQLISTSADLREPMALT
jgi:hypothetical protein